ncbi:MAG: hypothetical protein FWD56_01710 [Bacteroidales bacterium]|nr:hypothetical protein [Bacteroidales bacterium]
MLLQLFNSVVTNGWLMAAIGGVIGVILFLLTYVFPILGGERAVEDPIT